MYYVKLQSGSIDINDFMWSEVDKFQFAYDWQNAKAGAESNDIPRSNFIGLHHIFYNAL